MSKKMIENDPVFGAQDDYVGPCDFVSLAVVVGLATFVFWACMASVWLDGMSESNSIITFNGGGR